MALHEPEPAADLRNTKQAFFLFHVRGTLLS
jgi:hypothetical protein